MMVCLFGFCSVVVQRACFSGHVSKTNKWDTETHKRPRQKWSLNVYVVAIHNIHVAHVLEALRTKVGSRFSYAVPSKLYETMLNCVYAGRYICVCV